MPWSIWKAGYEPFEKAGQDSVFLATPKGNILWTCDPAIVKQLFTSHSFQLPVDLLKFYDIWGPTIGSVEGQEWKTHRKVVAYGFSSTPLPVVWQRTIHQTKTLVERWARDDYLVKSPRIWMSRVALHVIAGVFFNTEMNWKDTEEGGSDSQDKEYQSSLPNSILTIMLRLGVLFMTPTWLLGRLPFKATRETSQAFNDFTNYMLSIRSRVLENLDEVSSKRNKTMLESIVVAGNMDPTDPESKPLSKESVLGNIFFTMMAGHETVGNTLGFAILLLAIYPEIQTKVQQELDDVIGSRPKETWSLETDYTALQKGFLGAVINETLRLYHPVQFVPRTSIAETTLYDSAGKSHVVPPNTLFCVNYAAAFSNPATWTKVSVTADRRAELQHSRAIDFDPQRWLKPAETSDVPIHWPFGQGGRICPGKPMAQVEMIGVLTTLLKEYSIELVIPDQVLKETQGDRGKAWDHARDNAVRQLQESVEANLTIAMLKDLPIRLQRRSGGDHD
ncbi:cytochrome P450 [Periconia macrospinosa]|uniref:Cytochrome P450 n=1 Tax=Periconia macrospinosa TaxID=97972 RepID=A0A2V1DGV6_9PLEO|nr:cytochrome P450 [Periconia macrospinosa]